MFFKGRLLRYAYNQMVPDNPREQQIRVTDDRGRLTEAGFSFKVMRDNQLEATNFARFAPFFGPLVLILGVLGWSKIGMIAGLVLIVIGVCTYYFDARARAFQRRTISFTADGGVYLTPFRKWGFEHPDAPPDRTRWRVTVGEISSFDATRLAHAGQPMLLRFGPHELDNYLVRAIVTDGTVQPVAHNIPEDGARIIATQANLALRDIKAAIARKSVSP